MITDALPKTADQVGEEISRMSLGDEVNSEFERLTAS